MLLSYAREPRVGRSILTTRQSWQKRLCFDSKKTFQSLYCKRERGQLLYFLRKVSVSRVPAHRRLKHGLLATVDSEDNYVMLVKLKTLGISLAFAFYCATPLLAQLQRVSTLPCDTGATSGPADRLVVSSDRTSGHSHLHWQLNDRPVTIEIPGVLEEVAQTCQLDSSHLLVFGIANSSLLILRCWTPQRVDCSIHFTVSAHGFHQIGDG
jgi:hypothetical protein